MSEDKKVLRLTPPIGLPVASEAAPAEAPQDGTQFRDLSVSMLNALIEQRLEAERKKPHAAPSPSPDFTGGLWSLIPKSQRPLVVIVMIFVGGGSGTWLVNLGAIWGLPAQVEELKAENTEMKKQLNRIEALLQGSASKPRH